MSNGRLIVVVEGKTVIFTYLVIVLKVPVYRLANISFLAMPKLRDMGQSQG